MDTDRVFRLGPLCTLLDGGCVWRDGERWRYQRQLAAGTWWVRSVGVLVVCLASVGGLWLAVPPLTQPQAFHDFGDKRTIWGIPNFWNVVSNVPFLGALYPAYVMLRRPQLCTHPWEAYAWAGFFAAVAAVTFGSSYFHWNPNDDTLVWDRLPMTFAFSPLFSLVTGERVNNALGKGLLVPLLINGGVSILVWVFTGDLRWYAWVQAFPILVLPVLLALFPPLYTHATSFLWAAAWYVLATVLQSADKTVWEWSGGMMGGHALKHFAVNGTVWTLHHMLVTRRRVDPLTGLPGGRYERCADDEVGARGTPLLTVDLRSADEGQSSSHPLESNETARL